MRGSKAAKLLVWFLAVILTAVAAAAGISSAGESSAVTDAAKRTPPTIQTALVYPSNGVLVPGQPQMVEVQGHGSTIAWHSSQRVSMAA